MGPRQRSTTIHSVCMRLREEGGGRSEPFHLPGGTSWEGDALRVTQKKWSLLKKKHDLTRFLLSTRAPAAAAAAPHQCHQHCTLTGNSHINSMRLTKMSWVGSTPGTSDLDRVAALTVSPKGPTSGTCGSSWTHAGFKHMWPQSEREASLPVAPVTLTMSRIQSTLTLSPPC